MGTITKRTNPSGAVVYRAQIRVKKAGLPDFNESRTFSKKALAAEWLKRREAEIEANPEILYGTRPKTCPTLAAAVEQYLNEMEKAGRSKVAGLRFLASFDIGKKPIDKMHRADFAEHAMMRRRGLPSEGIAPICASTALQELQYIRGVLKHAFYVWNMPVSWQELDFAVQGLCKTGTVAKSTRRKRLPTREELQRLTSFFYRQWQQSHKRAIPMHLIIWLAIYTARRLDELCRMRFEDYDEAAGEWLIRDIKHPSGSKGNDKRFDVKPHARRVIEELMKPEIRARMMKCARIHETLIPLNSGSVGAAFTRACQWLEIEDLRFHDLRHEAATRLAEDGETLPKIQMVTLHDSWGSLQRYVNMRKRPHRLDFEEAMQTAMRENGNGLD